ncbi:hypothetical protein AVEN_215456-1 [Araneus ventricosus]|uniref:Uncharacterized protein n=1 Tax=Araneus ventricosus TaxID=182803 RepID=A0A4Y2LVU6_ARAVE|nr:hypothetical protein AVEN_44346-1 [Araneus ventricosus]GBN18193.1 hypothetical protein AVEN_163438-1 [Araneus ventricosus]GBN18196.1 hypothetical protein AVEN_184230-1 [Araneus ventricosus]GBN18205.1 hypothetical protein AVEN_215456-1 [Araneus ventricosus]
MTASAIARVLRPSPNSLSPGLGPTPPEGGTYYHWRRDSEPLHYYIPRRSEFSLTNPAGTPPCTVQQRIPRLPLLDDFTPERGVRQ